MVKRVFDLSLATQYGSFSKNTIVLMKDPCHGMLGRM